MGKTFSSVEERRLYNRQHYRVNKTMGKASEYSCFDGCGRQGAEWAHKHGTSGNDPENDFQAMCRPCHQKYDDRWNEDERTRVAASVKKTWEEDPGRRVFTEEHLANMREAQQRRQAQGR